MERKKIKNDLGKLSLPKIRKFYQLTFLPFHQTRLSMLCTLFHSLVIFLVLRGINSVGNGQQNNRDFYHVKSHFSAR